MDLLKTTVESLNRIILDIRQFKRTHERTKHFIEKKETYKFIVIQTTKKSIIHCHRAVAENEEYLIFLRKVQCLPNEREREIYIYIYIHYIKIYCLQQLILTG